MEIKYTRQGDYLITNLYLEKEAECGRIGKYGIQDYTLLHKINKHSMKHF